jgi:hypothetical protein
MQLVTLYAQFEAETGAKMARVQVNAALSRSEMHSWVDCYQGPVKKREKLKTGS